MVVYHLEHLLTTACDTQIELNGKWVPARPLDGPLWWRIKAAWWVLTGKADAFIWPEGQ